MARPLKQKRLRFIQKFRCTFDPVLLEKAVLWYNERTYGGKPMLSRRVIFGRGGRDGDYPAVNIGYEKILIHVLLVMYKIGGNIPEGKYVHHVNEDKCDASEGNLHLIDISEHQRHHNFGQNASRWRGRKLQEGDPVLHGVAIGFTFKAPATSDLPF